MHFSPLGSANGCPTGTGQHILYMAESLAKLATVERLSLLASAGSYARHGPEFPPSLARLPIRLYSIPEGWMRRIQVFTAWFPLDRWADRAEWIYCPKEQPVAVRKCRLAVMVHDVLALEPVIEGLSPASGRVIRRWKIIMRQIIQRAHLIATASEFTAHRLRHLCALGDDPRLCVIGNGVSRTYRHEGQAGDGDVLSRHGLTHGRYLLSVGSLTWRKGGDTLLELAQLLRRARLGVRLIVSGQNHDRDLVERMNALKGEDSQLPIDLIGYAPDKELAALYRGAKAFIFPSRYEGFGIPVLEAMACGTPVICSNAAALPEVAGDAAILVRPGSAADILDAVGALERDSVGRAHQIERGVTRAAAFTWDRCADRLVEGMRAMDAVSSGESGPGQCTMS